MLFLFYGQFEDLDRVADVDDEEDGVENQELYRNLNFNLSVMEKNGRFVVSGYLPEEALSAGRFSPALLRTPLFLPSSRRSDNGRHAAARPVRFFARF